MVNHICEPISPNQFASCRSARALQGGGEAPLTIKQDPMLLGADNWPVEIAPNPDKAINLPVHNIALTVNGVHLLENLVLEDLAKARAYEFAFVIQPLKLQGATGSTVAPTAIR